MAFLCTPLNAKRVPKYLDLTFVDDTRLTLSIAAPRFARTSRDQQAMRLLTAIHESAHFVAMVEAGSPPFSVFIAPNPISRRNGNCGMVCGANDGRYYEDEWFTTLVATGVEYLLLNYPHEEYISHAYVHDYRQSEKEFRIWCEDAIQMGKLTGEVEAHTAALFATPKAAHRVCNFIRTRWQLIELCATVFLIYADNKGNVGKEVIDELRDVVRYRLSAEQWPKSNRSSSPVEFRKNLPADVMDIWRKYSPHVDINDEGQYNDHYLIPRLRTTDRRGMQN